ncbi:MAG TPA: hypothetical protein VHB97_09640 [Polyangia bacterium]|nr:hypothetical protein [Polyangia bacterium]
MLVAVRLVGRRVGDSDWRLSMNCRRRRRGDGTVATDLDQVAVLGARHVPNEHEMREARELPRKRDDGQGRSESARRSISWQPAHPTPVCTGYGNSKPRVKKLACFVISKRCARYAFAMRIGP